MLILDGIRIALRALQLPPLANVTNSPYGQRASDRLAEQIRLHLTSSPYWFQQANRLVALTPGSDNGQEFLGGEDVVEETSAAVFMLICVDGDRAWLRLKSGTPSGAFPKTLTGLQSGATATTAAVYTALSRNAPWGFEQLPDPFAQWMAVEAGLDLERDIKRGMVDEQVLNRKSATARVRAEDFDSGWQGWRAEDRPEMAANRARYRMGPTQFRDPQREI